MTNYNTFIELCSEIHQWNKNSLPLCAAENAISPFCKIPLDTFLQEKYIMGGILNYDSNHNFVGSDKLFKFYEFFNTQCENLFSCNYADPRTLSGVNAVNTLLMSLFEIGDTLLICGEECGGHGSMGKICHRLGIRTIDLPYDYDCLDFDYNEINKQIREYNPKGILICLSDILHLPSLNKIELSKGTTLIFDATQILGLIAGKAIENPFSWYDDNQNFILMGATHKTLPGPTCGLIMTKNKCLASKFDTKINPDYLRNNQFHHILSLSLALLEMEYFGEEYADHIIRNTNVLGRELTARGFDVRRINGHYSQTHQLFISMLPNLIEPFMLKCEKYGITLNARYKRIYRTSGIRIGTQEITRYGWGNPEMQLIAEILEMLIQPFALESKIKERIEFLIRKKTVNYTFSNDVYRKIYKALHDE